MASLRNLGAHLGWTAPDDLRHTPNAAPCRLSGSREELRELGLLPEIGAVVLTINGGGGGSYDQLFSQVQQKGPDGTAVAVYEANYEALGLVAAALADPEQADALASNSDLDARVAGLVADVHSLSDAASFVLNFECCGCCSEGGFAGTPDIKAGMWKAIDLCLKRGSFVMASDFSLKAIIKDWDRQILGPKPFVQLSGTMAGNIDLAFDAACSAIMQRCRVVASQRSRQKNGRRSTGWCRRANSEVAEWLDKSRGATRIRRVVLESTRPAL